MPTETQKAAHPSTKMGRRGWAKTAAMNAYYQSSIILLRSETYVWLCASRAAADGFLRVMYPLKPTKSD